MGERGPAPKRKAQRHGHISKAEKSSVTKADANPGTTFNPLPANAKWHATAKRWYNALERSGQAAFYEESDWATAYLIAEALSRELKPQPVTIGRGEDAETKMVDLPIKGTSMAALLKGMSMLLVTEGDRRRALIELQRPGAGDPEEGDADVSDLSEFRNRLRREST